jgi:hypothetical protein
MGDPTATVPPVAPITHGGEEVTGTEYPLAEMDCSEQPMDALAALLVEEREAWEL